MTPRLRLALLGIPAIAVAASLALLATGDGADHGDRPGRRPRVQRGRPAAHPPVGAIDRRAAVVVARQFATAYAAWDADRRGPAVRRHLRSSATAGLIASLPREHPRPVAARATPLRLSPAGAYELAGGAYAVPLVLRGRRSVHVLTLVVAATPGGARVTRLDR